MLAFDSTAFINCGLCEMSQLVCQTHHNQPVQRHNWKDMHDNFHAFENSEVGFIFSSFDEFSVCIGHNDIVKPEIQPVLPEKKLSARRFLLFRKNNAYLLSNGSKARAFIWALVNLVEVKQRDWPILDWMNCWVTKIHVTNASRAVATRTRTTTTTLMPMAIAMEQQ